MKVSRLVLLLGLIFPALGAWAESAPDWYLGKPIHDIRFEGLQAIQKSELEGVVRPYLGKKFTDELFQDLQGALYNLDYFDGLIIPNAIKADADGNEVDIVFKVTEKPTIEVLDFAGNSKLRSGDLLSTLTVKKGEIVNLNKIKADEKAVLSYYLERGFLDAQVTSTTEDLGSKKVKVLFEIKEGMQNSVKKIEFQGLGFATDATLKGLMETKEQDFFGAGYFKEAIFTKDIRTIENYYWNKGYVDAKVVDTQKKIAFDKELDRNVLTIVISVFEGQAYLFGGFTFQGNQIFSNKELTDLVRQPVGKTISKERVDQDYQRVVDTYLENGYIFNNIAKKEVRDGQKISYQVSIVERPRAHIESIIVKGNTKTKERVVLREMPIEVGDVFSKTKIIDGIRNLYNLQYFSNVSPETPQGSAEGLMDLVLNVEEGKTADLSFGLAFSGNTSFPISATAKWSDKNFLGNGQTVGVDSSLSPTNQSLSLNFQENWFLDQRLSVGAQLGFTHATIQNITQDIIAPTYSTQEMPDPYDANDYVFNQDTVYPTSGGIQYRAGQSFPGVPTSTDISTYNLITHYQYDLNNGKLLPSNLMQYDTYQYNLGLTTGYAWYTPLGRVNLSTGLRTSLQWVWYDDKVFRPSNQALRNNWNNWQLNDSWWTKAVWDTRDLIYNPSSGFQLSQILTFGGGFLGGSSQYTRLDSRAEGYLKLVDASLFDFYDLKLVLKARTGMSFLLPPLGGNGQMILQPTDQLYIDGMLSGRGWGYQMGGKLTWINGLELRTPIVDNMVWFDTFLDHSAIISVSGTQSKLSDLKPDQQHYSWGFGLRVVTPQFPIAIYLAKPFTIQDNYRIQWEKGDGVFGSDIDMKLVVAFGYEM